MATQNIAEVLAKFSADEVAAFVEEYERQNKSTALANVILSGGTLDGKKFEGKLRPEDERPETFQSVDSVREALFEVASTVSEVLALTPGDPNGGNKNVKADRWVIQIPTPTGVLDIAVYDRPW